MSQPSRRHTCALLAALACGLLQAPATAHAADVFPNRPVTLIVPFGAGSTTDIFARLIAEGLGKELAQAVVVKNITGAGGTLGLRQMLREPADGYTLGLVTTSSIAINRAFYKDLPYDSLTDITIVGVPSTTPNVVVVPSTSPFKSVQDLAQAKAGEPMRYHSMGNGTSQQLLSVLLSRLSQLDAQHIPYRGQEGVLGMLGGQTTFGFASVPAVSGLADGGKLRMLASTGPTSPQRYPAVPTLASLGYKGFEDGSSWYGVGIGTKAPPEIKARLTEALARAAARPDLAKQLAEAGFEPAPPMNAAALDQFAKRQVDFWGALVKESGVKPD